MSQYTWRAEKALAFLSRRDRVGKLHKWDEVAAACEPEYLVAITHGDHADQMMFKARWEDALDELVARGDARKLAGKAGAGPETDFGKPVGAINYYLREERADLNAEPRAHAATCPTCGHDSREVSI